MYAHEVESNNTAAAVKNLIDILTDDKANETQILDMVKIAFQLKDSLRPVFKEQGHLKAKFGAAVGMKLGWLYMDESWPDAPATNGGGLK